MGGMTANSVVEDVDAAERKLILDAFAELKAGGGDAELRVAITEDRATKRAQVVYVGIHKKRSLEPLRRLYAKAANGGPR